VFLRAHHASLQCYWSTLSGTGTGEWRKTQTRSYQEIEHSPALTSLEKMALDTTKEKRIQLASSSTVSVEINSWSVQHGEDEHCDGSEPLTIQFIFHLPLAVFAAVLTHSAQCVFTALLTVSRVRCSVDSVSFVRAACSPRWPYSPLAVFAPCWLRSQCVFTPLPEFAAVLTTVLSACSPRWSYSPFVRGVRCSVDSVSRVRAVLAACSPCCPSSL
jgi:hypothetical protein